MREVDKPLHVRRVKQDEDSDGEVWQLRVEWDAEDGLIEIAEEKLTSASPDSQPVAGKGSCVSFRVADTEWLMAALKEAIARRDASDNVKDDGS